MSKVIKLTNNQDLVFNNDENITVFLDTNSINSIINFENGKYNVLVFNNTSTNISLYEKIVVKNSLLNITYIDLNSFDLNQNSNIDIYENSTVHVNSIYLGIKKKNIVFNLNNLEKNSKSYINNNVVCLNDASFELDIIGNIKKGAKKSECKQTSNCLTFESPKLAKVLPVLNIDENDVEAKHALSSGTLDEEVLFYMNSRGLNKKDALALILVSYLLPNDEFYLDFKDGEKIKEITSKKVNDLCLI